MNHISGYLKTVLIDIANRAETEESRDFRLKILVEKSVITEDEKKKLQQ